MSYTYTSVENRTLVDLIKKYQTHVLNTSTKKFAVENRNKSWAKITAEFNKTGTTERTEKSLRTRLANIKFKQSNQKVCQDGEDDPALSELANLLQLHTNEPNSNPINYGSNEIMKVKMEEREPVTIETLDDDESGFMDFDLLDTSNDSDAYTYHLNLSDDSTSDHRKSASSHASDPPNQSNLIDSMERLPKRKRDHTHITGSSTFNEQNMPIHRTSVVQKFTKHQQAIEGTQNIISNVHVPREKNSSVIDKNNLFDFVAPGSVCVAQAASIGQTNLSIADCSSNAHTSAMFNFPFKFEYDSNASTNPDNRVPNEPSSDILLEQKLKIKENKLKLLESLQQQVKFDMEMKQKQLELDETMKKKELELKQKLFDFDMELKQKQFDYDMEAKKKQLETDKELKHLDMEIRKMQLQNLQRQHQCTQTEDQSQ